MCDFRASITITRANVTLVAADYAGPDTWVITLSRCHLDIALVKVDPAIVQVSLLVLLKLARLPESWPRPRGQGLLGNEVCHEAICKRGRWASALASREMRRKPRVRRHSITLAPARD